MIEATINKILKSFNNLPKEYKNALYRILIGLADGIKALDELKVDKEDGKELSSNDFTDELKNKLDGIEDGAQKNVKSDWNATEGDALILNKPTFTEYPNAAEWDHINHKIIFKHDDTELPDMEIDGADFIKDGMIENIEIVDGNLVITFNTDHGREPISISLSDIFNPENYYTKEDINHKFYTKEQSDNKYVEKVTGKQLSTEDFTTELKEKLENIKFGADNIIKFQMPFMTNEAHDLVAREVINKIKAYVGEDDSKLQDIILIIDSFERLAPVSNNNVDGMQGNNYIKYSTIGYGCTYNNANGYIFNIIYVGDIFHNVTNIRYNRNWIYESIKGGAYIGTMNIGYNAQNKQHYFSENCSLSQHKYREIISWGTLQDVLGQITSYTNEQIEQLIAEGNQVKVFKLNITEDKTLLQQILTDNPEDGNVDITSVMYFVYDSTKQKYYDVNGITIETVESDRQINITAAIGRYDYTAVKINTNEAAYIINPSHVESANADWNENDEDKASYVKNRTHWKESGEVLDNIIKIYDSTEHTDEHLIAEYTPIEFREAFAQIIYNQINNIQTFGDIVFPIGHFKPFGADWQNYNLYSSMIHSNDIFDDGLIIKSKYIETSSEVMEEFVINTTSTINSIKEQLNNNFFIVAYWDNVYGIIALPMSNIEECTCKKVITDIIHPLDSKYLEDLTDEEINEILE